MRRIPGGGEERKKERRSRTVNDNGRQIYVALNAVGLQREPAAPRHDHTAAEAK